MAAPSTSRSPSPLPPPPLADSPGPRAAALQKVFADALSHTLKACSYSNFAACFPTPGKYVPESLDGLWRTFTGQVEERCKAEFDTILAERAVIPSLNSLDRLIADAKKRKDRSTSIEPPVPPHTLPPSQLYLAHLQPFLAEQSAQITVETQRTERENEKLAEEVVRQREEIEGLLQGLERVVRDIQEAGKALDEAQMEELSGEVREIDEQLGR